MVPLEVENCVLMPLAEAETLHPRVEHVPHIDQFVVTCAGHEISTGTELNAVDFALVTQKLQVLRHQLLPV